MNKKISVSIALAITLIAMTVTFTITMIVSMTIFDNTVSSVRQKQAFYDKLAEIDTYVRGNFYGSIDDATLGDSVAAGYIGGLGDNMSAYYSERAYNEMMNIDSGRLVGIGIEVAQSGSYYRIIKVYPGSPAEAAGLQQQMMIVAVDGRDTREIASERALRTLLRGEPGNTVAVTIGGTGAANEQVFEVQRTNFVTPTVEAPLFADGYAYIRIASLGPNTYTEFDTAVREALLADVKGIVFDLRFNTGGLIPSYHLEQVYSMVDMICPRGTIAQAQLKSGVNRVLRTSDEENRLDIPVVMLVNGSTAAGAELFAESVRAISGTDMAQVVGSPTAGRGTIQYPPQRMSDGSAVSITYGYLLAADGINFNGVGIRADVEMSTDTVELATLYNPDLNRDINIARGLELVRSMARKLGIETDGTAVPPAASGSGSTPDASSVPPASGSGSLPGSDASGTGEDASGSGADGDGGDDADAGSSGSE